MDIFNKIKQGLAISIIIIFVASCCYPIINGEIIKNDLDIKNYDFVTGEFIVKFNEDLDINICKSSDGSYYTGISSVDILNKKNHVTYIEKMFESHKNHYLKNIYKFKISKSSEILSLLMGTPFCIFNLR